MRVLSLLSSLMVVSQATALSTSKYWEFKGYKGTQLSASCEHNSKAEAETACTNDSICEGFFQRVDHDGKWCRQYSLDFGPSGDKNTYSFFLRLLDDEDYYRNYASFPGVVGTPYSDFCHSDLNGKTNAAEYCTSSDICLAFSKPKPGGNGNWCAQFSYDLGPEGNSSHGVWVKNPNPCQIHAGRDVQSGTFVGVGNTGSTASSASACSKRCSGMSLCKAWVFKPANGQCWTTQQDGIINTVPVSTSGSANRKFGLRCELDECTLFHDTEQTGGFPNGYNGHIPDVANTLECSRSCNQQSSCQAWIWHPNTLQCHVSSEVATSTRTEPGFVYSRRCYTDGLPGPQHCTSQNNRDVKSGFQHISGSGNWAASATACRDRCTFNVIPDSCNAWVWQPSTKKCWMTKQSPYNIPTKWQSDRVFGTRCGAHDD